MTIGKNNDEIWEGCHRLAIQQKKEEFYPLLDILRSENVKKMVSIGVYSGGTDWGFLNIADSVIALDVAKHPNIVQLEQAFPENFTFVCGNTHDQNTFKILSGLLGGEKIDALFIDGDHSAAGAMQDFEMYSPFVKSGGLVIFHDILASEHHHMQGCYVDRTWEELKTRFKTQDIILDEVANPWAGLGVLWMP